MKRPEIKITIPDQLKVQLVDDWEAVTKNMQVSTLPLRCALAPVLTPPLQLVKLPREPSVDVILAEWNKFHQNEEPETRRCGRLLALSLVAGADHQPLSRLTAEVAAGLRLYFNKALGNNLLYRFEREQYSTQMKNAAAANNNQEDRRAHV